MTAIEKTGLTAAAVIFFILSCLIVFSENGVLDYQGILHKERDVQARIQMTDEDAGVLEEEVRALKTDLEYLKHIAKHEHDMIEQEELLFKDKPETRGQIP